MLPAEVEGAADAAGAGGPLPAAAGEAERQPEQPESAFGDSQLAPSGIVNRRVFDPWGNFTTAVGNFTPAVVGNCTRAM
eukprot:7871291-Alexandrium_andersonii.AAC.1